MTRVFTTTGSVSSRAFTADYMKNETRYMRVRLVREDGADITEEDLEKIKNVIQLEVGTSATKFEPYKEPICYEAWQIAEEDAIEGIYPNTTVVIETVGSTMDVTYSRDLNKAFADLEQAIISLGGYV